MEPRSVFMGGLDVAPAPDGLARAAALAVALFPQLTAIADHRLREAFPGGHLDVTLTPPGGEPFDDLHARVAAFLDDVAPPAAAASIVLVTHNGWIRTAQYLAGEATTADFHARPAPHLVLLGRVRPDRVPRNANGVRLRLVGGVGGVRGWGGGRGVRLPRWG